MKKQDFKIQIVGAGASGLIAAKVLEDHGYCPMVIEASDRVGGRVKTDVMDGYQLDRGFQVLLTAYPLAQKYLDYDALDLQKLVPGAAIFTSGSQTTIGDPLRDFSLFLPTVFSGIAGIGDALKIAKLYRELKNKQIEAIFAAEEKTTMAYLLDYGFSHGIIDQFFKPFFSGIYLESALETSSRMFEFVFKMFGEGYAAVPKAGMEAIPRQLASKLKNTSFIFNSRVISLKDGEIELENGDKLATDYVIVAAEAAGLVQNLRSEDGQWNSCDTLYFETGEARIKKPLIGLVADSSSLINNIFYPTSLSSTGNTKKQLLSVTVVQEHNLSEQDLIKQVQLDLHKHCGISSCTFLKRYAIPKSLPKLKNLQYEMLPSETRLTRSIFLAGDTQLNASLNAAMMAGERAALGIIESIRGQSF